MSEATAEQQIETLIRTVFRNFVEHRPEDIESTLHEDCTIWDVFVPELIRGKENRARFHAADQAQSQARGPLSLEVETPLISVWGDTALARYYVRFSYQPPNAVAGVVRITSVYRREHGVWKTVHHHEGLLPSGIPPIGG